MSTTIERKVGVEFSPDGSAAIERLDNGNDFHYVRYNGVYFHKETPLAVVQQLNTARLAKIPVRVYYGDATTGRDWHEENDVQGKIGNSMGPLKIPLLLERDGIGGSALLDHCIVKIKFMGKEKGRVVYQHPLYHTGVFTKQPIASDHQYYKDGYRVAVQVNGKNHANFKKESQADAFIQKMTS